MNATRLVAEGVVVVASILIAFALDAWWADRQLHQEMAEDLAIVEHELAENKASQESGTLEVAADGRTERRGEPGARLLPDVVRDFPGA